MEEEVKLEDIKVLETIHNIEQTNIEQTKNQNLCRVRISVEDTGIGIKAKDIGKLFKIFGKIS